MTTLSVAAAQRSRASSSLDGSFQSTFSANAVELQSINVLVQSIKNLVNATAATENEARSLLATAQATMTSAELAVNSSRAEANAASQSASEMQISGSNLQNSATTLQSSAVRLKVGKSIYLCTCLNLGFRDASNNFVFSFSTFVRILEIQIMNGRKALVSSCDLKRQVLEICVLCLFSFLSSFHSFFLFLSFFFLSVCHFPFFYLLLFLSFYLHFFFPQIPISILK